MIRCSRSAVATLRRRCWCILTSRAHVAFSRMSSSCCKPSCAAHTRRSSVRILIRRAGCTIRTRISGWLCVLAGRTRHARTCVTCLSSEPSQARYARSRCIVVVVSSALHACTTRRRAPRRVLTCGTLRTRRRLEAVLVLISSFTHTCRQVFVFVHGVDGSRSSSYWFVALHNVHDDDPTPAYVSTGHCMHAVVLSLSRSA